MLNVYAVWQLFENLRQTFVKFRFLKVVPLERGIKVGQCFDSNVIKVRYLGTR